MSKKRKYRTLPKELKIFPITHRETRFGNGLLLVTEEVPYVDSFAIGIGVNIGSRGEPEGLEGISHLVEHSVFRRTQNYTSSEINELFERYGAYANAFTTKEYTSFYVRALNSNFKKVWDLLFEVVFRPKFHKTDLAKEKSIIKEEIRSYIEDPEEEIFDLADKLLYRGCQLSNPIVGYVGSVHRIKLDDVKNFYSKNYIPSNTVVTVVSKLNHESVLGLLGTDLDALPYLGISSSDTKRIRLNYNIKEEFRKHLLQSHFVYFCGLPKLDERERLVATIFNVALGDSASSRLYKNLREKYGLVYNVFSSLSIYSDNTSFYIYSSVEQKKLSKAKELILQELYSLYDSGLKSTELEIAKEQIKSSIIIAQESISERMQSIIKNQLTFGYSKPFAETISIVESIGSKEISDFIVKYLHPEKWSSIVFLPK